MPSTTLIRPRMSVPAVVPDVADRLRPSTRRYELSMRWTVGPASAAPDSPLVCTWISLPSTEGEEGWLSAQPGLVESDPAVLDDAHIGDINCALGTLSMHDRDKRRTWKHRLGTLAAIMGHRAHRDDGDKDPGGVATYTQAGQKSGHSLLWVWWC